MRRIDMSRGAPPPDEVDMSRGMALVFVLVQFVAVALGGPSAAADGIGIVLLHGKQGMPKSQNFSSLTDSLTKAGLLLERPEMSWSRRRRIYDRSIPTASRTSMPPWNG